MKFHHYLRIWLRGATPSVQDYQITFGNPSGKRVLNHLIDRVYGTVYEGVDPIALAKHEGRRSVVHEILEHIDMAEHPERHTAPQVESYNGAAL